LKYRNFVEVLTLIVAGNSLVVVHHQDDSFLRPPVESLIHQLVDDKTFLPIFSGRCYTPPLLVTKIMNRLTRIDRSFQLTQNQTTSGHGYCPLPPG
jgi:hypothetical protein